MFFGSLLTGYFGDKYGRRIPSYICVAVMFAFALVSAFASNYWWFMSLRTLYGVTIGFFSPLNFTILGEITPKKRRGTAMTLIGLFYVFGELVCCLIAYYATNNLDFKNGNWRALLMYSSFMALICFVLLLFWLDESPRYNLITGKYE